MSSPYPNVRGEIVILTEDELAETCLGRIGSPGSTKFCLGSRECGIASHSTKLSVRANTYYAPGAINRGFPTARIDPALPAEQVPPHLLSEVEKGMRRDVKEWVHTLLELGYPAPKADSTAEVDSTLLEASDDVAAAARFTFEEGRESGGELEESLE